VNVRRTTLLIASILAVGTGWLTLTYLSSLRPPSGELRAVLIAAQDIAPRERITDAMLSKQVRPASAAEPGAISDPSQAIGSLALITIPAGTQLTASEIGTNVAFALPVRLQPGMRAVSIPVDRVKDVSGLIQPGDRVDVIAIPPQKSNGPPPKAVTIFRAIRVLSVGSTLENASATPSPAEQEAATVTLEVTPAQADLLAWADANSTLRLALRSPREAPRTERVEELTLAGSGMGPGPEPIPSLGPPAPVPAPPMTGPAQASGGPRLSTPVELIIGDQVVDPRSAAAHK
jgi:pilus assembly protein CpaB